MATPKQIVQQAEISPLEAKCIEARTILTSENECVISSRFRLGAIVAEVANDTAKKYGSNAIQKMSQRLGVNTTILYDANKFVELYSEEDLDNILAARSTAGFPLCWSHIQVLIHVDDDKLREKFLIAALKDNLSASDLGKKIKAYFDKKRGNSTGRPMAKPKDLAGYLDSIKETTEFVDKKIKSVWLNEDENIVTVAKSLENVDDSLFDDLEDTTTIVANLQKAINNLFDTLCDLSVILGDKQAESATKPEAKPARKAKPVAS